MRTRIIPAMLCLFAMAAISFADPLQVTVSIPPQKYFVEKIGGSLVKTMVMAPAGGCAETYEPKPQQMTALSQSRIYFAIGFPFEDVWLPRFAAANPRLLICRTDKGIQKLPLDAHHEHEATDNGQRTADAKMLDPHIWLSPPLVRIQAKNILWALQSADAASSATYQKNFEQFNAEITKLDEDLKKIVKEGKAGRAFLVFHPTWGYFASTYGLEQMAVEIAGREPAPREMKEIIDKATERGIKVVFVQPLMSPRLAESIARNLGGIVISVDPLSEDWENNLRYFALQLFNKNLQIKDR